MYPTTMPDVRLDCLAFADQFPTPNVKSAILAAELGQIGWVALYQCFQEVLAGALAELKQEEPA
jgi:hypothetical protein